MITASSLLIKLKSSAKLGFLLSVPTFIWDHVTTWGIDNSEYLIFVMTAIAIDHVLGTLRHLFLDSDFSFRKNITGICVKVGLVVAIGMLFEGLNHIITKQSIIKDYLIVTTRLMVFLYPAGSAFSNSSKITGGKFPPGVWLLKLKEFQKNLDPAELGNKKND